MTSIIFSSDGCDAMMKSPRLLLNESIRHRLQPALFQIMEHDKKEIVITGESLLVDIRDAFSRFYPFLAIDFFQKEKSILTLTMEKIEPDTPVKTFANMQTAHTIDFNSQRTVLAVSHEINSLVGVTVRISRKSGRVWNAISVTEGWTLERQNTAGQYISEIMEAPAAAEDAICR